jgi:hypothetical protein
VRWLDAAELSSVNWLDADRAALPAVLEELTSEPEAVSPEEITISSEEAPPDEVAEPAAPTSSERPRISRRWPRR